MCVMVISKYGPPDVVGSRRSHVFGLIINKTDGSAWLSTPEKQEASARARGKWGAGKQGPGFHHQAPISVPCSESVVPEHNVAHLDGELLVKWKICLVIYFSKTKSSEEKQFENEDFVISVDVDAGEMQANSLQCFGPGVLVVTWSLTPTSVFCTLQGV